MTEAAPVAAAAEEPVGTALARAREAAGLPLDEVARRLRYAPRQLDALERGEWGRLPGGAAVRGMVRSYAKLLGLDDAALVARVAAGAELPDAERLAQRFRQPFRSPTARAAPTSPTSRSRSRCSWSSPPSCSSGARSARARPA